MAASFGVDMSMDISGSFPDINPVGKLIAGDQLLQQALVNRLFNDKGSYLQSLDFGINLASYQNARLGADFTEGGLAAAIENELRKDIRVSEVDAKVTFNTASSTLTITIQVTPVGSGIFTISIGQVSQGSNFTIHFQAAA